MDVGRGTGGGIKQGFIVSYAVPQTPSPQPVVPLYWVIAEFRLHLTSEQVKMVNLGAVYIRRPVDSPQNRDGQTGSPGCRRSFGLATMPIVMGGRIKNGELHAGARVPDPHTRAEEHELEAGSNSIPFELNSLVDQEHVNSFRLYAQREVSHTSSAEEPQKNHPPLGSTPIIQPSGSQGCGSQRSKPNDG